jgi:hypothetical protein
MNAVVILIELMNRKEKIILFTLAGLIATLTVYVTLSLWSADATFSIVPGWHTTIYPPEVTWSILIIIILVTSLLVYLIFRGTTRLLTSLWARLKS